MDHGGDPSHVQCSDEEVAYMCDAVNRWLDPGIRSTDVTWRYAGGRPLLDDGAGAAAAVTRDYRLDLDTVHGHGGLLTVVGGKVTTYRKLAEQAVDRMQPLLGDAGLQTRCC